MSTTRARKRNPLRDAIFSLFSCGGLLLGMWTALPMLDATPDSSAKACESPTSDAITGCFGQTLSATVTPIAVHVATYALAGMVLGAALALLLVRRRA